MLSCFNSGEQIWDRKFLIVTPESFDKLDYTCPALPGYVLHPNILCLFRMVSGAKTSEIFNVVRINPEVFADKKYEVPNYKTKDTKLAQNGFRSHLQLLTDGDVYTPKLGRTVLAHELGHAIGLEHILALKGDQQCKVNPKFDRCYGGTVEEMRNIMGSGKEITQINVKPWTDALQNLVGGPRMHCYILLLTNPAYAPLPPLRMRPKGKRP